MTAQWEQINVGETDADDWRLDLPEGHTLEIGPGEKGYDVTYVVRVDGVVREEIGLFVPLPDRETAMAAAETVPVCATCGLPIHRADERLTGWDHIQWDDLDHQVTPRRSLGEVMRVLQQLGDAVTLDDAHKYRVALVRARGLEVSQEQINDAWSYRASKRLRENLLPPVSFDVEGNLR